MAIISYRRYRFPTVIIQHAIWLYLRFTLSYRDVEELLAERGLDISYEGGLPPSRLRKKGRFGARYWGIIRVAWRDVGDVRCAVGM